MGNFFKMSFDASRNGEAHNQNRKKQQIRFSEHELHEINLLLDKHRRFGKLASKVINLSERSTVIFVSNGKPAGNCVMTIRKFFDESEGMYKLGLSCPFTKDHMTTPNLTTLLQFANMTLTAVPQVTAPSLKIY